jgi:hypothetical protein
VTEVGSEAARAYDAALALALEADRSRGPALDEVRLIGGLRLRLHVVGPDLARCLLPALDHHARGEKDDGWDVEIRAWDTASNDAARPWFPDSALDGGTSGPARIEAARLGPHLRVRYQPDERVLSLYDPARAQALFCADDAAALPYWERGAPMRTIFHWIMEERDRCLVHAAAVGRADGGLLIVGRGGSGKSTTALSCLGHGVPYLSDDYCIVGGVATGRARAYSLYSTAKLHHDQLARLPHLATWQADGTDGDRTADDKALLFVAQHAAHELVDSFPIRAVVVPVITGGPTTSFGATSAGAALAALAPSSVLQLPGGGADALALLADLVRATPCVELRLGTDIDAIADRLDALLDQLLDGVVVAP